MTSINTSISNSFVSNSNTLKNQPATVGSKPPTAGSSYTPSTFNYPPSNLPKAGAPTNNENLNSNLPVIKPPQFVSKYT